MGTNTTSLQRETQTHRHEQCTNRANAALLVRRYRREFVVQANLYVLDFFATNFFAWVIQIVLTCLKKEVDSAFILLASIFYPLGGLFNILVYTRPKVLSLRRNNPRYSWFQAFTLVMRAGVVVPMAVVVEDENSPAGEVRWAPVAGASALNNSHSGQEPSLSSGDMFSNLRSLDTPPVDFANALSSGIMSMWSDSDLIDLVERREYYQTSVTFPLRVPAADSYEIDEEASQRVHDALISSGMNTTWKNPRKSSCGELRNSWGCNILSTARRVSPKAKHWTFNFDS